MNSTCGEHFFAYYDFEDLSLSQTYKGNTETLSIVDYDATFVKVENSRELLLHDFSCSENNLGTHSIIQLQGTNYEVTVQNSKFE